MVAFFVLIMAYALLWSKKTLLDAKAPYGGNVFKIWLDICKKKNNEN